MQTQQLFLVLLVVLDIVVWHVNLSLRAPLPEYMLWLQGFVSMNFETNLPTWYITMLTAICGVLLWILAFSAWRVHSAYAGLNWALLGSAVLFVSLDEFAQVHEQAGGWMRNWEVTEQIPVLSERPWTIPVLAGLVIFLVVIIPFLQTLPKPTLFLFVAAGAIYVSGAVGVELGTAYVFRNWPFEGMFMYLPLLEEVLEKMGFILFLRAILDYMAAHFRGFTFAR